jgi:uncharacterized protein YbbC (DUF1343 family)/CubicO group peptidase (beta-lactamase class C family)
MHSRQALLVWTIAACALVALAQRPQAQPRPSGLDSSVLSGIDALVQEAIAARLTPGAIVMVGRGDEVVYQKAFGQRATEPMAEAMTLDTIFDLASLTKVVATTTAVMRLVEQGRIRLVDPVHTFIPGFDRYGKGGITIRHLLTHVSGLRPDVDLGDAWEGTDAALELARDEVPVARPGERFIYSDINFFVLGAIVARVSGQPLDAYTRGEIFEPLGMTDTRFNPPESVRARIAPSERCTSMAAWPCNTPSAAPLRGVVHDPTARRMGGVAGHAGLFSTARDLSRFARMLLHGGTLEKTRILSPLTVQKLISPATPGGMPSVRGLGWDIDTSYSANRGELMPIGSFGHTGFTGTSLWIDPRTGLYVIFLSSRLHPDGKGDVTALRGKVATVAASALTDTSSTGEPSSVGGRLFRGAGASAEMQMTGTDFGGAVDPLRPPRRAESTPVLAGIDVLERNGFAVLKDRRVGLLTNHTGRALDGRSTIDVLHRAAGMKLVALFSPEHGIRGTRDDENVSSSTDEATGLPIHSLYGETRRPTEAMLAGIDTLVIDLQDVGVRFYTYTTTMAYAIEEAGRRGVKVVVLDRPNPIDGWRIEGPAADQAQPQDFIAYMSSMPVRHGMTLGELAQLFNGERKMGADLSVVPAMTWINPSPNMRNLNQATVYPGIGAIEWSNVSVGRGTDQPFEQIGAPWIDGRRLAMTLSDRGLPGIRFYPVTFTPSSSQYAGQACQGVFFTIVDRNALQPVRVGLEIAAALWKLHPDRFEMRNTDRLLGSRDSLERVKAGEDPAIVATSWAAAEARWRQLRAKYLLYR